MLVVRPVTYDDLDAIYNLASQAETGLTTLPADLDVLSRRIKESVRSFSVMPDKPGGETYFFVLEDLDKKKFITAFWLVPIKDLICRDCFMSLKNISTFQRLL